jgi:hypothetical protein
MKWSVQPPIRNIRSTSLTTATTRETINAVAELQKRRAKLDTRASFTESVRSRNARHTRTEKASARSRRRVGLPGTSRGVVLD